MGHKKVCLNCRLSFNRDFDTGSDLTYPCPICHESMLLLPHRFRPPKKGDDKMWKVASFLISNGFRYQHIYENVEIKNGKTYYSKYVSYPENIREAEEFIVKYKSQAI